MIRFEDIREATGGTLLCGRERDFSGLSIDSRHIKNGELFVALKGERFDGHDFVADALKTAGGALVSSNTLCAAGGGDCNHGLRSADYAGDKSIILVHDTLQALQALAGFIRRNFAGPVIVVAGSNGKTTTKELLSCILSARMKILKTTGNLNNHIGMPLTIARIEEGTVAMVLEMGTNRPGDVDELCRIAPPDIAVITNIGYEHLEGFGSLEKVRDSELELLPYVKKLVVNADDLFLMGGISKAFTGELITFAIERGDADITAHEITLSDEGASFVLQAEGRRVTVRSRLPGRFNIYNSLAAAAAAHAMGSSLQDISAGLGSFEGVHMRFEIERHKGVTFLNDSYNANPSSMEESVKELVRRVQAGGGRAIVVLGDMLELGAFAADAHTNLGLRIAGLPVERAICVGPLMELTAAAAGAKGTHADSPAAAAAQLQSIMREGDNVLIKGSRGMRMEKVLAFFAGDGPGETA
jgi:UDP-N-acetylmuramoyl-tripeptide--D-alanyl-D-alanine ligase